MTRQRDRIGAAWSGPGRGFTLIEVLVVIVVISVAAAVIVPQMLNSGTLTIQAAGRMIIADLVYAQNEAIAQQSPRRLVFNTSTNSYSMTDGSGNALPASWRSEASSNYTIDLAHDKRFRGVALDAASFNSTSTIEFDALGSPAYGGNVDIRSGGTVYRITVAPMTGRITIAPVTGG